MSNVELGLSGDISRRLGLLEEDASYSLVSSSSVPLSTAVSKHDWPNPAGRDDLNFIVIQIGSRLHIRNADAAVMLDPSEITGYVDLAYTDIPSTTGLIDNHSPYGILAGSTVSSSLWDLATTQEVEQTQLASAPGLGRLFMCSPHHLPFWLEFDPVARSITLRIYTPYTRDFVGVPSTNLVTDKPAVLTADHYYNLRNAGWNSPASGTSTQIQVYQVATGVYPARNSQWVLGKNATNDFDPAELNKRGFGTGPAPRGSLLVNILEGDRDYVYVPIALQVAPHNLPGPYNDMGGVNDDRTPHGGSFRATGFFAGRVWLSGHTSFKAPNGVYFSRVMNSSVDAYQMFQTNDPTSENFSELLDNDGGVIYIEAAQGIFRLIPFGNGMLVVANNGLWHIRGGEGGFNANLYAVDKIAEVQLDGPDALVVGDGFVSFWGDGAIYLLSFSEGANKSTLISTGISNYLKAIPKTAKQLVRGFNDTQGKRMIWLVQAEQDAYSFPNFQNIYNRAIVFDLRLLAFYPYDFRMALDGVSVGASLVTTPGACGVCAAVARKNGTLEQEIGLVYDGVNPVVLSNGDSVVAYGDAATQSRDPNYVSWLTQFANVTAGTVKVQLFNQVSAQFKDYSSANDIGWTLGDYFDSHILTGDQTLGDVQREKEATYIHSFFSKTERGYVDDGSGAPTLDRQSSCIVTSQWNWTNSGATSKRWSAPQYAYRLHATTVVPAIGASIDNGDTVVHTKLKAPGYGRALAIRYESVDGYDFKLLGFAIPYTVEET
ncbi:MAG: hypothetical protein M0P95_17785 [Sulfuritalea sp.]|nr:hypothetical protein [Sulfuritalea sp.]